MNVNDPEPPKEEFLVNFSLFLAAGHISRVNCNEMPEESTSQAPRMHQDNLHMKFSASNIDF